MGVGYPLDILCSVALGVDMFDCVWPCRTARFGTALVPSGQLRLPRAEFKADTALIDKDCGCPTCLAGYTRAYLHTVASKSPTGSILLTQHNIFYMMRFMQGLRDAIREKRFHAHVRQVFWARI